MLLFHHWLFLLKKWRSSTIVRVYFILNRNIYVKICQVAQNTEDRLKKTWLSLKGISYLQVIFVLIWMKQTLIWFNLQRDGTGNGLSNIKDTFAESLQLQMSVLHQSMCIFKAGLSSSYDGWAKYKEKVPDVSDLNENVEIKCNSKLKLT